ncbi:MAG: CHAT domain-containing protein [Pyrinomonadaceae bacterium]|nr:CHAT domain-containing protein [Pyrinomonadaceae bacterium]
MRIFSIFFTGLFLVSFLFAQSVTNLVLQQPVEREIKGGEAIFFSIKLEANQTARLEFEAKGISLFINGYNPKGEKYLEVGVDTTNPKNNFVFVTAKEAGDYKIEIIPVDAKQKTTKFTVKLAGVRSLVESDLKFNEATSQIIKLMVKADVLDPLQTEAANRELIGVEQEIIRLADITGDKVLQARTYLQLNFVHRRLGEHQKAYEAAEKCLNLWRELGNKSQQAVALNSMGVAQNRLRNYKAGIANLEEALQIAKELKSENIEGFVLNNLAIAYDAIGESDKAIGFYLRVVEIQKKINNQGDLGRLLASLGLAYFRAGNNQKAESTLQESLQILKPINDKVAIQSVFTNLGLIYARKGETRKAIDSYSLALEMSQQSGNKLVQASSYSNLAQMFSNLGEYEKSLDYFKKSYAIHLELGSQTLGETLNNLASTYRKLGENEQAFELFNQSLEIRRKTQDKRGEATTLANLGEFLEDKNDLEKARANYEQALALWRESKDRNNEGKALTLLGNIERKQKNFDKALDFYNQSVESNRAVSNKPFEAVNLVNIGLIAESKGEFEKSLENFNKAKDIYVSIEDQGSQAEVLFNQARVKKNLNQLAEAKQDISAALEIIEKLRSNIPTQTLRSSYYATVQKYYELAIEIMLKLHTQDSSKNFNTQAFELSERGRSRSLLELLREANVSINDGADGKILQREKELSELISQKAFERTRLLGGKFSSEQKTIYDNEIRNLGDELESLQSQIRKQSPQYSSLTQAIPLSSTEIQNLLDSDTVLLEFKLGENQSYLWMVTKTNIKFFYLPDREEIEKICKEFYEGIIAKKDTSAISVKLNQILFSQISAGIKNKRLTIVADGILQFIPFANLVENEIVTLPSASVLAELRQKPFQSTEKTIEIFADPVFAENDVRLANAKKETKPLKSSTVGVALRDFNLGENLPRLLSSRFEANSISTLVPQNQIDIKLDFDANRENITNQNTANYRILHFATHGLLDSSHPEFSGLVFSLYDKEGNVRDGFLRLNQIYNLKLNSDLVVLSACQTALGKDVRGEGLIGLTRGFMYAGAKRIVASLWKVDDAATAEFMKKFYQNLLVKKLKPVSALRQTQNEIKQITRFKSPYFWAGFTIQGDWR